MRHDGFVGFVGCGGFVENMLVFTEGLQEPGLSLLLAAAFGAVLIDGNQMESGSVGLDLAGDGGFAGGDVAGEDVSPFLIMKDDTGTPMAMVWGTLRKFVRDAKPQEYGNTT